MNQVWLPFSLAWAAKLIVLRYGGIRLYRESLPLIFGGVIGDYVAGGVTTLIGCFTGVSAYPINW